MGFFYFLKKAIIKEKELDLINISDIIQIPGRDYYKDDLEMIKLIDTYKEKYHLLLSQRKTMVSKDIKFDSLQDDMVMNVDLLVADLIGDDFLNLASEELMVQIVKFKMYLSEIAKMEKETISRLIALKELKKSKKIPYRNRNCLNEEISNLSNSLIVFLSQKTAILNETDTYFSTICNVNKDTFDEDLLTKRYDKALYCSSDIVSMEDVDKIDNTIIKIAYIDRCLEIYAYKHKDEIKLLDEKLKELDKQDKNKDNKRDLLCEITSLEQKYLVFYEYGKDIVSYDQMKELYKLKFDILTCDIDFLRKSPISIYDYGYDYYRKMIMEKIEVILKGENENIKETFKERANDAISVIRDWLKNNDNEFNFDQILRDKYILNLLLSFDKKDGFMDMLDNNTLRNNSFRATDFYEHNLLGRTHNFWDDEVPLKTYLYFLDLPDKYIEDKRWNIYTLYKMIDDEKDPDFYKIPEGIKELDQFHTPANVIKKIQEESDDKIVVMPSSLRTIRGNIFDRSRYSNKIIVVSRTPYVNCLGVVLNDGLDYIGDEVFKAVTSSSITIPSSVRKVASSPFNRYFIKTIVFDDFTNSLVLHDENLLTEMLYNLFERKATGNSEYYPLSEEASEAQRRYWQGDYSVFPSSILYERPGYKHEVKIETVLDSIVLKDNETVIEIKADELSFLSYVETSSTSIRNLNQYLSYTDCWSLTDKIREVILEKTGYDIFEKANQKVRTRH